MRLLVFSRTTGYRHDSIPAGRQALEDLGAELGLDVLANDTPQVFRPDTLADVAAVAWMNSGGTVLDDPGRAALEAFVRGGGGWLGVHFAAGTEPDWPFAAELLDGARFTQHPKPQRATLLRTAQAHPSTAHLPPRLEIEEEWYSYSAVPTAARVLLTVDEASYAVGEAAMGNPHPIAWCHERLGGRCYYTGLGHAPERYAEPFFRTHLREALRWVTRG